MDPDAQVLVREGQGEGDPITEAWVLHGAVAVHLTDGQIRKPLLGAGGRPMVIRAGALAGGPLLVGSDGLFRYVKRTYITSIASGASDLDVAARSLVESARLPTGGLQDDVALVLVSEQTASRDL